MEVYLITGATSGIGQSVYNRLSKQYSCLLIARNKDRLNELIDGRTNQFCYACDLAITDEIKHIFQYCAEQKLKIKGLIYCAGLSNVCDFSDIPSKSYYDAFAVNVFAFIEMCKYCFKYSDLCDDARIIAISSIAADRASARQAVYASTKAALNNAIISAAQEGINRNAKVNGISLGACDTSMLANMNTSESFRNSIGRHYPLGMIDPNTVAEVAEDFLSEKFKNMTGSIIRIDSGFSVVH